MADPIIDPLRTDDPPIIPPTNRVPGTGYIECDFCHCKLTKLGEVYSVSEQAREFRDQKEKFAKSSAKSEEDLAALRSQIADKDAEIARLKGSPATNSVRAGFL